MKITAQHIRALATDTPRSVLVDVESTTRFYRPADVLVPGTSAGRIVLTRAELRDEAGALGLTLSEYVTGHGAPIAARLREELDASTRREDPGLAVIDTHVGHPAPQTTDGAATS